MFGLVGMVMNALFLRPQVSVITLSLFLLLSCLRFFRIKLQRVQSEKIWGSFALSSNIEIHVNTPLAFSYFAEFIGWMSFIEFYIVAWLKKCLTSQDLLVPKAMYWPSCAFPGTLDHHCASSKARFLREWSLGTAELLVRKANFCALPRSTKLNCIFSKFLGWF